MLKKKEKKQPVLKIPVSLPYSSWVIVGLDLSLSRTGYSVGVLKGGEFTFIKIGSLKPETSSNPVWLRSNLIAKGLLDQILTPTVCELLQQKETGLLFSLEAFTPQNDFLSSINRIVHTIFLSHSSPIKVYPSHILSVNASTLRSLMGLTKTGAKNKHENIEKAYTFLSKTEFPELDTDSCDAVLLAIMGQYAAKALSGAHTDVPERFLLSLCNGEQETKGNGPNQRIITKGLLHRSEYWYIPEKDNRLTLMHKDASTPTKKLNKVIYPI